MKLTKIEIKGLFDLFDYDIPLTNEENLLIITGPNGFGKTMILNIIDSFFNNKLEFFQKLVFKSINIWTDNSLSIIISKEVLNVKINVFKENNELIELIDLIHSEKKISLSNTLRANTLASHIRKNEQIKEKQFYELLDSVAEKFNIYLIKEQRLLRKKTESKYSMSIGNNTVIINVIEEYAIELQKIINDYLDISYDVTQQIDSSFPKRLLSEKGTLSIEEFDVRFKLLKEKQEKLKRFGLSESEQEIPDYDEKNAGVLLVYLKDSEDKIKVFDELLNKLELFTNILNERRFTYKSIKIDRKKGFIFLTKNGVELSLTDLSSGEQHEVVLLYELIFKTNPNTLVLIDEPEISLHVTWQKEFLSDLLKILELQKMQVIVATHSPQIINDRWDLVFNLETKKMQ